MHFTPRLFFKNHNLLQKKYFIQFIYFKTNCFSMKKFFLLFITLFSHHLIFAQQLQINKQSEKVIQQNDASTKAGIIRCSTMDVYEEMIKNNPKAETLEQFEAWLQEKIREQQLQPKNGQRTIITIPYIIHVIHNGEAVGTASNIPSTWIDAQMAAMNRDFRYVNPDKVNLPAVFQPVAADFEIEFCPAIVDPLGNVLTEPGVDRVDRNSKGFSAPPYSTTTFNNTVKPATIWNPDNYFNIWTANIGSSLLGYATFPSTTLLSGLTSSIGTATTDGVVINYLAFGDSNPGLMANFDKGRTLVHEAGHWLGLRHIWGDGTCATDYCNDTPTQSTSNTGCPTFPKVTCSNGPNGDMFYNYMDYSNDVCMYCFTADQKTRAVTIMNNSPRRLSLQNSLVCALPGTNVAVTAVTPPCTSGANKTVTVTIKNKGGNAIIPGEVSVVLNTSGGVTGSYSAVFNANNLNTNDTETVTFTNVDLNSTADITISAIATLANDAVANDNSLSSLIGTAVITPSATSVCSATNFTVVLTKANSSSSLQWQSSTDNVTFTNISGATTATLTTSQTVSRYYRCKMNCGGVDYFTSSIQINLLPTNQCYCSTTYTNGCNSGDAITKVVVGTLSNTSTCGTGFYTFFNNATIPNIVKGVASSISVTFGSDNTNYCGVWIDANNDGTFSTTEFFANNTTSVGSNGTYSGTITIPNTFTYIGQTRMRIRGGNDAVLVNTQACGTSSSTWGETEDYLVNITAGCTTPTLNTPSSITNTNATVSYTCTGCTGSYIVEYGLQNFTPGTGATAGTGGTVATTSTTSYNITGLTSGTTYDVYVRQNCGSSYSTNAVKKTFTTTCSSFVLPFQEGFNGNTLSSCFSSQIVTAGATSPSIALLASGTNPTAIRPEGARMIFFNSASASAGSQLRVVSPTLSSAGVNVVEMSFQMLENNGAATANDKVIVQYSTDNGTTWNDVAENQRYNPSVTATWYTRYFTLPADAGNINTLKVAMLFTSALGTNIYVDDLNVYATNPIANVNNDACQAITLTNVSGFNTFRVKNAANSYAEIKPNGVNLETLTFNVKENLAGFANIPTLNNGIAYIPRYFNINSTTSNPFPQNVDIKFYVHYDELNDYNQATNGSESIGTLTVWEYDNAANSSTENCITSDNLTPHTLVQNIISEDLGTGFTISLSTNHFTEFGIFPESGISLPITVLNARVYLSSVDTLTGLMPNYITGLTNFPMSDPYSASPLNSSFIHVNNPTTASTTPLALIGTGANAIVDWVFIELRTGTSGSTSVVYTRAGLLQGDGDIVNMDGITPLTLNNVPAGNYYVSIRHRFHLGCRTSQLISLNNTSTSLNFTNNSLNLHGVNNTINIGAGKYVMISGDANGDGSIDAFDTIVWENQNGLFDDYQLISDYNLDGSVDALDSIIWEFNNGKFQELD